MSDATREQTPFVSVVVPCRNEAAHIRRVLASLLRSRYPRDRMEAIFVDGMSEDGTREILEDFARRHPFIRVLDNPRRIAPTAMNAGIKAARGEIIVRMDGHAQFLSDYIPGCVDLLRKSGAGCAGGTIVTLPGGKDPWARAVAVVTRHKLGVGDSAFRVGVDGPRLADTVPCGTFWKRVLEDVGLFDERLTRNQDNELTARLRHFGYTVVIDPRLRFRYWNQASLRGLLRQGFNNGKWNVYTVALHPYTLSARHFVPAAFVLYLYALAAAAATASGWAVLAALPLLLYALLVASMSFATRKAGGGAPRVAATVVSYHVSYGLGTHVGLFCLATGLWRGQLGRPLKK